MSIYFMPEIVTDSPQYRKLEKERDKLKKDVRRLEDVVRGVWGKLLQRKPEISGHIVIATETVLEELELSIKNQEDRILARKELLEAWTYTLQQQYGWARETATRAIGINLNDYRSNKT